MTGPSFTTERTGTAEKVATTQHIVGYLHDALDAFAHSEAQRQGYSAEQRLWPVEEMLVALGATMVALAQATDQPIAAQRVAHTVLRQLDPTADPIPAIDNAPRH